MHPRAAQLVRDLSLQPHPEGGHFAEVHRSPAVTTIYFLLREEEKSRWHRVKSEEIWHFYEGAPLELLQLSPDGGDLERVILAVAIGSARFIACRQATGRRHDRAASSRSSAALSPRHSSLPTFPC